MAVGRARGREEQTTRREYCIFAGASIPARRSFDAVRCASRFVTKPLYRYSAPVRLAEHVLRFNPRPDAGRLLTRTLSIDPTPIVREETLDPFGNLVTRVAFDGLSARFAIDSRFEIEVVEPAAPQDRAPPPLPWPVDSDGSNAAYCAL